MANLVISALQGIDRFKKEAIIKDNHKSRVSFYKRDGIVRQELIKFGKKVTSLAFEGEGLDFDNKKRLHSGIIYIKDLSTRHEKMGQDLDSMYK